MSETGAAIAEPAPPVNLSATNGECGQVTVNWTDFAWDVTYRVYRNETGDEPGDGDEITPLDGVIGSPFNDTTASDDGTLYYYWVTSETLCGGDVTESGVGVRSEGMAAFDNPAAPENVVVSDGDACNTVDVQWTPSIGVDVYNIYRSEIDEIDTAGTPIGSVTQDQITYSDATAVQGVTYFYWVVGETACGESANVSLSDSGFTGTLNNPENIITTEECGAVSPRCRSTDTIERSWFCKY
jgi:hypothetical protein